MRVVPRNKQPQVQFFMTHLEKWTANSEAIGTTPEMVATLADQTEAARLALVEQQMAQQATRNATLKCQIALERMATTGAAILLQIRARAQTEGAGVYSLALLTAPAKASPIGAPGTPTEFTYMLDTRGALKLRWKCKNPRGAVGTIYEVRRSIGMEGELTFLGTTGQKRLIDDTIPAGTSRIVYQIRAIRSTAVGDWAMFNVSFGTTSASATTRVAKLAA
ncbi:hypothetical protein BH09PLA1_BH09PLA1_34570 [soil metagenome]